MNTNDTNGPYPCVILSRGLKMTQGYGPFVSFFCFSADAFWTFCGLDIRKA